MVSPRTKNTRMPRPKRTVNTPWAVIFPLIGLYMPFGVFWMRAHFINVPRELSEAARVDGAVPVRVFFDHTLPLLTPVLMVSVVLRLIDAIGTFDQIFVLTKGGPANGTHVFGTYAYQTMGFSALGEAASIALSMFPFLAIFAALLLRQLRAED